MDECTRPAPLSVFCCFSFGSKSYLVRFIHTPVSVDDWAFSPRASMDFLCVFAFVTMSFFAMASVRPWWYTAERATEFIMNYDSDENDYDVASFLLCSVFCCLCVVYCVCVVYSLFMSIISLHMVNIFLTQMHNHSFSVLLTKRKQTLHLCRTNISTLLCESFKPLY